MNFRFLSILSLFLFVSFIHSQECTQPEKDSTHSLYAGSWSLQFGVSGNFTLSSFNGGTISGKYHLSDNSAIRTGVTINGQMDKTEEENLQKIDGNSNEENSSTPGENLNMSLNTAYLYYPTSTNNFKYFIGSGLVGTWRKYRNEEDIKNFHGDTLYSTSTFLRDDNTFEIGLQGLIGIEYFISSNISLHAEYASTLSYFITKNKYNRESFFPTDPGHKVNDNREIKTKGWKFTPSSVRFGISVYL
jgi:opacity protein-like surface antigen